jgi:hypothetical protein
MSAPGYRMLELGRALPVALALTRVSDFHHLRLKADRLKHPKRN